MLQCDMGFDEFQSIWNSLLVPRRRMFTVTRHLQRQVGLLFLSNTNEMNASVIDPDVSALTDKIIYSYRAGCLKPQRAIYQRALKMSRASPEKTLFIDDRIEDLQGAAPLGIRTHHFQNRKTLCRMFRSFGLKMPLFFP
jgi:putative hydrolase of the HAD superfamily